jgi:hypothetical protein
MPTLSNYWFQETDFRGSTNFLSIGHDAGGWAWINSSNLGGSESTLVWERQDNELLVDLPPLINALGATAVDRLLGSSANRTSSLNAGWIPWRYVPYHDRSPGRHGDLDLLVRLFFNFHIGTPWYCSDANGNISYYVVPYLDSAGKLHAYVDGWSYDYGGGGPFCTGSINDHLNSALPGGIASLQSLLDSSLAAFASRSFSTLYLLPGDGARTGTGVVNVDEHVSLALLPR